ncbi:unnamed protein product, partial [Polarella glacialis]
VVYPLLEGGNVGQRLLACRQPSGFVFPATERLRLVTTVASALSHLRSCARGFLHQNLTLSSIAFDRNGDVKLTDFGFDGGSKSSSSSSTTRAEVADGLSGRQVAELRDLGRIILELLVQDFSTADEALTSAVKRAGPASLVGLKSATNGPEILQQLLKLLWTPLDRSAGWSPQAARDVAE